MRCKRLLRFYFNADALESALDNLILRAAMRQDYGRSALCGAEDILELIASKDALGELWAYLDGVIAGLGTEERGLLEGYAALRTGTGKLPRELRLGIKRATAKFARRVKRLDCFGEGVGLVGRYYCLL